jgi:hypothetical protein
MNKDIFEQQYRALGFDVKPLPSNYTPDSFAQQLMKDIPKKPSISYSANTKNKTDSKEKKKK